MSNANHVAKLKKGMEAWNLWRRKSKQIPDLRAIDLSGADLRGVDLGDAILTGAVLSHANLLGANLDRARLSNADLSKAKLSRASLRMADLVNANLIEADLQEACLSYANLQGANLWRADLSGATAERTGLPLARFNGANLTRTNLSGADLRHAKFIEGVNFTNTNLTGADLTNADFYQADLSKAILTGSNLDSANFSEANLAGVTLSGVRLAAASLSQTDLRGADLKDADLSQANLVRTKLQGTNLGGANVYGASVWDVETDSTTIQRGLVITFDGPRITVDDLGVAQFIYLLLNRKKLQDVLETMTSKAVLILGRFTPERKLVLDAMADELRRNDLVPIIFDFDRATTLAFTETIKILAGLCLFVIVDITKPRSVPQELQATVPDYQRPFIPIMEEGEEPYSMFRDLMMYDWVLKPLLMYRSQDMLIANFKAAVIDRAWNKHKELHARKNEALEATTIEEFMRSVRNV